MVKTEAVGFVVGFLAYGISLAASRASGGFPTEATKLAAINLTILAFMTYMSFLLGAILFRKMLEGLIAGVAAGFTYSVITVFDLAFTYMLQSPDLLTSTMSNLFPYVLAPWMIYTIWSGVGAASGATVGELIHSRSGKSEPSY